MRCRNQANGREHDLQCPQKEPRGEALGLDVTRRLEFWIASKAPQIPCRFGTFSKTKIKPSPMSDWLEFICAEALLDEPTEFVCGCGGDIVQRIDEEDFFCWDCCTRYEAN
jgi:hypothetical protein